jgi:hypothetical protein
MSLEKLAKNLFKFLDFLVNRKFDFSSSASGHVPQRVTE